MFDILRKSFATGIATTDYPHGPPTVAIQARGEPVIDFKNWKDARPAAKICPTAAIAYEDRESVRTASIPQCAASARV